MFKQKIKFKEKETNKIMEEKMEWNAILYPNHCDDNIDMGDAVLIMQSLANPNKYQLSDVGKFNGDVYEAGGGITTNDAFTIQKYLLGLIKNFPESYAERITTLG